MRVAKCVSWAVSDDDSSEERKRKELLFCPSAFVFIFLVGLFVYLGLRDNLWVNSFRAGLLFGVAGTGSIVGSCLVLRTLSVRTCEIGGVLLVTCIALTDWSQASMVGAPRTWPCCVLVVDMLLVVNARAPAGVAVIGITMLWLLVDSSEQGYRWGMYRIEGWSASDEIDQHRYVQCADPPCATGLEAVWLVGLYSLVYLLDAYFTRGFAMQMRAEQSRVQLSIEIAEQVAEALVVFDLDRADSILNSNEQDGRMPRGLHTALADLLTNLHLYKPYLPQAVLGAGERGEATPDVEDSDGILLAPLSSSLVPRRETHTSLPQTTASPTSSSSPGRSLCSEDLGGSVRAGSALGRLRDSRGDADMHRQRERVATQLEVGLKQRRRGSALYMECSSGADFAARHPCLEKLLCSVREMRGTVVFFTASVSLSVFNAHQPCPRHARQAVRVALATASVEWGTGLSAGHFTVGHVGTQEQRSASVEGANVVQAAALSGLCERVHELCLASEQVHELLGSAHDALCCMVLVDVVPSEPRTSRGTPMNVYAVWSPVGGLQAEENKFSAAMSLLRTGEPSEAEASLTEILRGDACPAAVKQARRLMAIARSAAADPTLLPAPYCRLFVGWGTSGDEAFTVGNHSYPVSPTTDEPTQRKRRSTLERVREAISNTATEEQVTSFGEGPTKLPALFCDPRGGNWRRSEKCLGRGAFGEVWLGVSSDDGVLVAMKAVPLRQQETSPRHRRRKQAAPVNRELEDLLTEIDVLGRLQHDHIVCYLGATVVPAHVVLIMEYVAGGSLEDLINRFGALPVLAVRRYSSGMLRGLEYLHSNGIVHRDFKPGNVLLQSDGETKIADFGASGELLRITRQEIVGTPLYMAPEACRGHAVAASDVWSVGVTVCEMLTGEVPYKIDRSNFIPAGFVYQLGQGDVVPEIPQVLFGDDGATTRRREFAQRCLCSDPAERSTASHLLSHPFLTV
eukprot:TRINITY_DN35633_c0_g1_i1.p1 TRINITY_DN35633_c0_g1~~TRINITY_DN35633_c0_g1_i1.p1  ORF type:complete len:995 (+),score=268.84 TRINITY_DN35633_c0_g1_i1:79-2985(+)